MRVSDPFSRLATETVCPLKAFDTLSPDFPVKQLHLMCIPNGGSWKCLLFSQCHHLGILSIYLIRFSISYSESANSLFFQFVLLGKNRSFLQRSPGFPSRCRASCRWHCYHSTGPPWLTDSRYQNANRVSCCHRVLSEYHLPNFDPKCQQPSSFWQEGERKSIKQTS